MSHPLKHSDEMYRTSIYIPMKLRDAAVVAGVNMSEASRHGIERAVAEAPTARIAKAEEALKVAELNLAVAKSDLAETKGERK